MSVRHTVSLREVDLMGPPMQLWLPLREKFLKRKDIDLEAISMADAKRAGATLHDLLFVAGAVARADADADRLLRHWMADVATTALPIFEKARPDDSRVRDAIDVARRFADHRADDEERRDARVAARAAACGISGGAHFAALAALNAQPLRRWGTSEIAMHLTSLDAARACAWRDNEDAPNRLIIATYDALHRDLLVARFTEPDAALVIKKGVRTRQTAVVRDDERQEMREDREYAEKAGVNIYFDRAALIDAPDVEINPLESITERSPSLVEARE